MHDKMFERFLSNIAFYKISGSNKFRIDLVKFFNVC